MNDKKALPALKAAFPHTLPILAGFIVLGMGYGIYLRSSGLPLWYPTLTSILVFGGSLEFLLVSMLLSPFQPISVFFTFSINCSAEVPEGVDEGWFMLFVSFLNQSYWVFSVTLGSVLGGALSKYSEGVEFVMTAMFCVIFIRAMEKKENRISGVIGVMATLISLLVFGKSLFLIPGMVLILILLFLFREKIEKGREAI